MTYSFEGVLSEVPQVEEGTRVAVRDQADGRDGGGRHAEEQVGDVATLLLLLLLVAAPPEGQVPSDRGRHGGAFYCPLLLGALTIH